MKFAEIGMPRTGTRSLAHAMQILGYKVRHGISGDDPLFSKTVGEVLRGEFNLSIYKGFDYVGNFPHLHWRVLGRVHQDLRFIYTTRSIDEWVQSCWKEWSSKRAGLCSFSAQRFTSPVELLRILLSVNSCGSLGVNVEVWSDKFLDYEYLVLRELQNSDRFLMMNVFEGDGWEKLCAFTGDPIPDVPFPNTTEKIR